MRGIADSTGFGVPHIRKQNLPSFQLLQLNTYIFQSWDR